VVILGTQAAGARHPPEDLLLQPPAQSPDPLRLLPPGEGQLGRPAEADDPRHVFGAWPEVPLLAASPDRGDQMDPRPDPEGPHPLGAVDLVGAHGQKVTAPRP